LFVLPSKRRNGYALEILSLAENICKELGAKYLGLGVGITKDYQAAMSLYIDCGYKPDGLGLYHRPLKDNFVRYQDTITIDNSTTLWFIKKVL
jgi:GNAT superfamily N-acetyltransferase